MSAVLLNFLREAGGGALLGLVAGGLAFLAMRGIDEYNIELMISLALVSGTYGLAQTLGVSGPVAVVIAGLLMGSIGVRYAVSGYDARLSQQILVADRGLLERAPLPADRAGIRRHRSEGIDFVAAAIAISLSLAVRGSSITAASLKLNLHASRKLCAIGLLIWSGLRGGISVALALSLPESPFRSPLVTACYAVVIFTMIVQGLTLGRVAGRLYPPAEPSVGRSCSSAVVVAHVSPAVSGVARNLALFDETREAMRRSRHPAPSPQPGREQLPVPEVRPARRAPRHSRLCRT